MTKKNKILILFLYLLIVLIFLICFKYKIPCVFKKIFKIPCPACGMTRAFKEWAKKLGLIKEKDKEFEGDDCATCCSLKRTA